MRDSSAATSNLPLLRESGAGAGTRGRRRSNLPALELKGKSYNRSPISRLPDATEVLQRTAQGRSLRGQMGVMLEEIGVSVPHLAPRGTNARTKMSDSSKSFARREVTLKHQLKKPKSRLDLEIERLLQVGQVETVPGEDPVSSERQQRREADSSRSATRALDDSPATKRNEGCSTTTMAPTPQPRIEASLAESQHSPSVTRSSHLAVVYALPHQNRRQSLLEVRAAHLAELIQGDGTQRREKVRGRRDTVDFSIVRRVSDSSTTVSPGQTKLTLALFGEKGVVAQELEQLRRASSEEPSEGNTGDEGASTSHRRETLPPPKAAKKRSSTAPLHASGPSGAEHPVVVPLNHRQLKKLLREQLLKANLEREQQSLMKEESARRDPLSYLESGPMYI